VLAAGLALAASWRLLNLSAASSFTGKSTLCTDRKCGELILKIGVDSPVLIAEGVLQVILTLAGVAIIAISNYRATIVFYMFRSSYACRRVTNNSLERVQKALIS